MDLTNNLIAVSQIPEHVSDHSVKLGDVFVHCDNMAAGVYLESELKSNILQS